MCEPSPFAKDRSNDLLYAEDGRICPDVNRLANQDVLQVFVCSHVPFVPQTRNYFRESPETVRLSTRPPQDAISFDFKRDSAASEAS
jgi:hypothetical protein